MKDWYSFLTRMIIEQFPSSSLTSTEPTVSVYDLLQSYGRHSKMRKSVSTPDMKIIVNVPLLICEIISHIFAFQIGLTLCNFHCNIRLEVILALQSTVNLKITKMI